MTLRRSVLLLGAVFAVTFSARAASLQPQQRWSAHGPFGGGVSQLEIDPRRPSVMYAATSGGVFKSTNGGRSWSRSSAGLPVNAAGGQLEVAPSNPSVLYLNSGPRLYRSDNAAASWRELPPRDPGLDDLAVDPRRAQTVYGATRGGLLRSTDGGGTWSYVGLSGPDCIAVAPSAPNVMYGEDYGQLMRSADGGATWARMSSSLSCTSGFIAVDPSNPNTVYFTSGDGIQKSTEGGARARVVLGREAVSSTGVMAIDPVHPQRLYVGTQGQGIFSSLDGGASWTRMSRGFPRFEIVFDVEVAPTAAAPVFAGLYHRGVLESDGRRWRPRNNGLIATDVEALVTDPRDPETAYAGLFRGGVAKTTNGGRTWRPRGLAGEIVYDLAIDPRRPWIVYAAAGDLFRSSNGGRSWKRLLKSGDRSFISVAIAPSMPRVVYAGKYERGLWHSFNGGRTWRAPELRPKDHVWSIAVHPRRPLTVWAGISGSVVKSVDGGVTWLKPGKGIFEYSEVWDLVVHPTRPRTLYAGVELGGVQLSTDGGAHWRWISEGLPSSILGVEIDPRRPRTVYVGGYGVNSTIRRPDGVFRTTDGGRTWTDITAGMTTNWVASLALNRTGTRLYAGTTGYGRESGGGVFATRVR